MLWSPQPIWKYFNENPIGLLGFVFWFPSDATNTLNGKKFAERKIGFLDKWGDKAEVKNNLQKTTPFAVFDWAWLKKAPQNILEYGSKGIWIWALEQESVLWNIHIYQLFVYKY